MVLKYKKPTVPDRWVRETKLSLGISAREADGSLTPSTSKPNPITGKVVVLTGSTTGLGYEIAITCAENGAECIVMLNRSSERAEKALRDVREAAVSSSSDVKVVGIDCDLMSFDSVRKAAAEVNEICKDRIDVLILNAGIMAFPFDSTVDGYDLQMQTNVLSHFLLTKQLFQKVLRSADGRVVSQSSLAAKTGPLRAESFLKTPDCTKWTKNTWDIYGQTKLSNLVFAEGLQNRLDAASIKNVRSFGVHPGISATELQVTTSDNPGPYGDTILGCLPYLLSFQSPADGALPTLLAAFGDDVIAGANYGPGKFLELRGAPRRVKANKLVHDKAVDILWRGCEAATGVTFAL
jgi:NAD(P)-dependent dehydrogenase (short-subunit alcohol dehydrogenase family)